VKANHSRNRAPCDFSFNDIGMEIRISRKER